MSLNKCSVEDCTKAKLANGYCVKHYYRVKRHGDINSGRKKRAKCSVEPCIKTSHCEGFCSTHYMKIKRSGTLQYLINLDGKAAERNRTRTAKWKKDNWSYYKAYLASRKTRVKDATPSWADIRTIREFYKNCPKSYHVDHIVPVKGKNVSGLHVIWNLQYLEASKNLSKGNKEFVPGEFIPLSSLPVQKLNPSGLGATPGS